MNVVYLTFALCLFACSEAVPMSVHRDCKLRQVGCIYESRRELLHLDCSSVLLDEAPVIGKHCPIPKSMVLRLTRLTKKAILRVPSTLKEITIHSKNLKTFSSNVFWHLKELQSIDVGCANLHCDCALAWIKTANIDMKSTKCSTPAELSNKYLQNIPLSVLCDVNECQNAEKPMCDSNARCNNTYGSYTCKCNRGFTGNGKTCSDIDECKLNTHDCSPHGVCTNTIGSFECGCKPGFYGNGRQCTDYDECSLGNYACDARTSTCVNTNGSYNCPCKKGFRLVGKQCEDRNECAEKHHQCTGKHMACLNTYGSYKCGCKQGYRETDSACLDIDECTSHKHNCSNQATCTNVPGAFQCSCNTGYLGNGHYCLEASELSMAKRFMNENPILHFLHKRKLIPIVLAVVGTLLMVCPVSLCLCVTCCKRRKRRRKYRRISTDDDRNYETISEKKKKKGFFRRRKKSSSGSRDKPTEDLYLQSVDNAPAPPPPRSTSKPPPPPPPPTMKKSPT